MGNARIIGMTKKHSLVLCKKQATLHETEPPYRYSFSDLMDKCFYLHQCRPNS